MYALRAGFLVKTAGFGFRLVSIFRKPQDKSGEKVAVKVGDIIDPLPSNIPAEADGAPVGVLLRAIGFPKIDASKMPLRTWLLLNEAITSYQNLEYNGCLALLQATVESWLDRLEIKNTSQDTRLYTLIEEARKQGKITDGEAVLFNQLRKYRDDLLHSLDKDYLIPKEIKPLTPETEPPSQDFLNSRKSKDLFLLVGAPEAVRKNVSGVIEMMQSRYPTDGTYSYVVSVPLHHARAGQNV